VKATGGDLEGFPDEGLLAYSEKLGLLGADPGGLGRRVHFTSIGFKGSKMNSNDQSRRHFVMLAAAGAAAASVVALTAGGA
jgi:hypothetical protein